MSIDQPTMPSKISSSFFVSQNMRRMSMVCKYFRKNDTVEKLTLFFGMRKQLFFQISQLKNFVFVNGSTYTVQAKRVNMCMFEGIHRNYKMLNNSDIIIKL